jgi:hypothetical protein
VLEAKNNAAPSLHEREMYDVTMDGCGTATLLEHAFLQRVSTLKNIHRHLERKLA